ncbi:SMI1/KNR4 family protein [Verrucomicrobium sp. BvORR106]|uniref:SMI1/KNR4 family protein n=1 Tax=Verrucomicrobium sp. BvORR106 TaxID=1403819 RepID=UPI00056F105B|nr:SMI1/KNR4 family protein [Verrucomicrobium sp. BvORR106]
MSIDFQFVGKCITEQDLNEFETRHGVSLPDDYRRFMLACNGGTSVPQVYETVSQLGVGLQQLYSLHDDQPYDLDRKCKSTDWEDAFSRGYLRIGRDAGGSGIFLSTRGDDRGCIFYFDREEAVRAPEGPVKIADSFRQLMTSLSPVPSSKA